MIYDCFPFFNELMLLEIRLKELAPVVDKFVLVEATHTHSGKEKRLYYSEVKDSEVFAPFRNKIIHRVFGMFPKPDRFENDRDQRDMIQAGLTEAEPDDIIIISDLDEIIHRRAIPTMKHIYDSEQGNCSVRLSMKLFYYYFNCRANQDWDYPVSCRWRDYQTANSLRLGDNHFVHRRTITNAGWHFSYLAPPEDIPKKLEAFAHAEYDTDYYKNVDRLRKCVEANEDIFERGMGFSIEPLDAPQCVMENVDKYGDFIKDMRRSGTQFIGELNEIVSPNK